MKNFIKALLIGPLCGLFFCLPAYAQKTGAQINSEIITLFPDNTIGQITPTALRTVSADLVNSIMPTAPVVANNLACFSGTTGLLKDCGLAPTTVPMTVGTTSINSGVTTKVLFDNAGVLGEYTVSGSGSVCMSISCVMTTPALGTPVSGVLTNATGLPVSTGVSGLGSGVAAALGAALNATGGIPSPTPTRAGDVIYWNGSSWTSLAGNNSGTQVLQETSAGVPSWATLAGTGTVTSVTCGTGLTGGTFTTTGTCALNPGAWTTYTPTITPTGGAFTTVTAAGSFYVIGKLVHFTVTITETNIGTGTGKMNLPVPTGSAVRGFVASCVETNSIGKMGSYSVLTSGTSGTIAAYDNSTTFLTNGFVVTCTGIYEQA